MKLIHKLFHRMINRSCKLQGCSLIYTGKAKYLDAPVLLLTLGICDFCVTSFHPLLYKYHHLFSAHPTTLSYFCKREILKHLGSSRVHLHIDCLLVHWEGQLVPLPNKLKRYLKGILE